MKKATKLQNNTKSVNISLTLSSEAHRLLNDPKIRVVDGDIISRSVLASMAIEQCYGKKK